MNLGTAFFLFHSIPLDVEIPITRESALVIFSLDEEIAKIDYELTYAIEYLDSIYNK